jgi:predicted aldo/keto reductase-like oxidoreductase
MQKRLMGKTGEEVSLLGFGCMRFPTKDKMTDMTKVQKMVDYAMEHGVNYYDTAYVYGDGDSERAIAQALKKYPRDSYYLADKLPLWEVKSESDMEKIFNTSLERLGTDYFDFYLVHAMDRTRIEPLKKFNVIEFLKKKRSEGKIKHIGFSFHDSPETLEEIVQLFDWEFVQLQLNYLDWKAFNAKSLYDVLCRHDIPCVVMEPIRGGSLSNPPKKVTEIFSRVNSTISPSAWALKFCASQPQIKVILSGMSDFSQVKENIETLGNFTPMGEKELSALDEAVNYLASLPHILCTGCEYCMPCPKNVYIPAIFRAYNTFVSFGDEKRLKADLENEIKDRGTENCVKCGLCKTKCPQHLDIPNLLPRFTEICNKHI